jgi:hypothetical protein
MTVSGGEEARPLTSGIDALDLTSCASTVLRGKAGLRHRYCSRRFDMTEPYDESQKQYMGDGRRSEPVDRSVPLMERIAAVEAFVHVAARLLNVGELKWSDVEADYRLLAINAAFRRQIESMRAAVALARQDLGHLAVAFVRPSLEDVMYLHFFVSLPLEASQKLLIPLGKWDGARSLLAQRAYLGDDVMAALWYPKALLDAVQVNRYEIRAELKTLREQYHWSGGDVPSASWIAEQVGQKKLYDYLHAATSRSVHFSVGEILRRGWGHPSGNISTDNPGFRQHLAEFALDQLWRLHIETWKSTRPLLCEAAGISTDDTLAFDEMRPVLDRLNATGRVPLVHAAEWNLTPEGPLRFE